MKLKYLVFLLLGIIAFSCSEDDDKDDFDPIAQALIEVGYDGFVSAEAFADPDPDSAARQTISSFRQYFVS